jgi:predicted nuclease with TOPRIM domain
MNKKILTLVVMLSIFPGIAHAEEKSLADQVAEAKTNLQQEQALNTELKAKFSEKEKEITMLKQRARTLDEEIAALKEEHGLEEDV